MYRSLFKLKKVSFPLKIALKKLTAPLRFFQITVKIWPWRAPLGFLCLLAHPPQTCTVVGVLGICRRVRGESGLLAHATCLVPKSIRTGASSVRFHRDAERVTKGSVPQPREWRRELARGWPDPHIQPPSLTPPRAVLEN